MNKMIMAFTLVFAMQFCFADGLSTNRADIKPKRSLSKAVGGFIMQPVDEAAPHIVVTDKRKVTDKAIDKFITRTVMMMHLSSRSGEAREKDISIVLVDEGEFVIYPDKLKAIVTPGKDENETEDRLMTALVHILGVEQGKLGPQIMGTMLNQAKAHGIPFARRTTYKQAVKEGWAPAPTNDIQRAVWDSVKNPAMTNTPAK